MGVSGFSTVFPSKGESMLDSASFRDMVTGILLQQKSMLNKTRRSYKRTSDKIQSSKVSVKRYET